VGGENKINFNEKSKVLLVSRRKKEKTNKLQFIYTTNPWSKLHR